MATIGRFPDTLADRCILVRMQRKLADEPCERLRDIDTSALRICSWPCRSWCKPFSTHALALSSP
jgi:hypothetical protein